MRLHPITGISAQAFTVPTDHPESDGTLEWQATTIVIVRIHAGGRMGIGYTYAHACLVELIQATLAPLLLGQDCFAIADCRQRLLAAVRNLGVSGLSAMAISACDIALWDLKGQLLGLPLVAMLGACREACPIYGSGGFTSYDDARLAAQLGGWAEAGLTMVKMKVGREAGRDRHRVQVARTAIGPEVSLFVDANGAYQPAQAVALALEFATLAVRWFEEPVPSLDARRMHWVRTRLPAGMDLAGGEYQFSLADAQRLLDAQAVDVLQADVTRCLGISGFLETAALCAARGIELSAHCAPAVHLHLGCALPAVRHLEWFHDHVRIESLFFEGAPAPVAGQVRPDPNRPGLGLVLKEPDMARYAA